MSRTKNQALGLWALTSLSFIFKMEKQKKKQKGTWKELHYLDVNLMDQTICLTIFFVAYPCWTDLIFSHLRKKRNEPTNIAKILELNIMDQTICFARFFGAYPSWNDFISSRAIFVGALLGFTANKKSTKWKLFFFFFLSF